MLDKVIYEYVVIWVVFKVEWEEFFNIGVILFFKWKWYLGMKYKIDDVRIIVFFKEVDFD